jgi:CheY-like chemotaxis protein
MILILVDDLMFTSKIRSAASHLDIPVRSARSSVDALRDMRTSRPSLVILDLNNPRTGPLETVAAMKADPDLSTIPTVGFVSHVQTDVIAAAEQAGVDQVLPRSTFTQRLPEILAGARVS